MLVVVGVKPDPISERTRLKIMILCNSLWLVTPVYWLRHGIHGPISWMFLGMAVLFAWLLIWSIWSLRRLRRRERDIDSR